MLQVIYISKYSPKDIILVFPKTWHTFYTRFSQSVCFYHLGRQYLSKPQHSHGRCHLRVAYQQISDIYSSSSWENPQNHKNHNFLICHESFKHFNTRQTQVDIEFLVIQTSKRPFIMIHCIPRSDLSNNADTPWPLLRHDWYYHCILPSKTLSGNGTSGMRHCNNSKHLFSTLNGGYVIAIT